MFRFFGLIRNRGEVHYSGGGFTLACGNPAKPPFLRRGIFDLGRGVGGGGVKHWSDSNSPSWVRHIFVPFSPLFPVSENWMGPEFWIWNLFVWIAIVPSATDMGGGQLMLGVEFVKSVGMNCTCGNRAIACGFTQKRAKMERYRSLKYYRE